VKYNIENILLYTGQKYLLIFQYARFHNHNTFYFKGIDFLSN